MTLQEGRAAHGPLHPAVRISLGICRGLCLVVFRFFWSLFALILSCCFSQGLVCYLVLKPFRARPVFGVLSVSLLICLVRSLTPFSLFLLSLSFRRWENPSLFGLGFPLCFCGHDFVLQPGLRGRHLHQGSHPACCFFSFAVIVRLFGGGWSWFVGPLSLSDFWVVLVRLVHACKYEIERGVGLLDGAPIIIAILVSFWG